MTEGELTELRTLIAEGREHLFYCSSKWQHTRGKILKADRYECQTCKAKGRYTKAHTVHHVHHLRDRPDLALSPVDEEGCRQLISVCKTCHEIYHPEWSNAETRTTKGYTNTERWD